MAKEIQVCQQEDTLILTVNSNRQEASQHKEAYHHAEVSDGGLGRNPTTPGGLQGFGSMQAQLGSPMGGNLQVTS